MIDDVDFGKTSADYSRHRAGFPDSFFERVFDDSLATAGSHILDLGTGTGMLARGFAARSAAVTGLDNAPPQIDEARRIAARDNLSIEFAVAPAEATGQPNSKFDLVVAGQCWHWFDHAKAAAEVRRVLKPGGHLVIAHMDWLPLSGNVVAATEGLIEAHNRDWDLGGSDGRYPGWRAELEAAKFSEIDGFEYDIEITYSHESWRGRIRASAGVGGTLAADAVARFDDDLAALLADEFSEDPLTVPHRVWAMTAVAPQTYPGTTSGMSGTAACGVPSGTQS